MSAKVLSPFVQHNDHKRIYVAHKGNLRCYVIRLKDDRLCLFSPVLGLNATAIESLEAIGKVAFVLAPNYYHNKALAECQAAFPRAQLCASKAAIPRLKKITGLRFSDPAKLRLALPRGCTLIEPEGLKTGELWLRIKQGTAVTWMVVDAISGPKMTPTRLGGAQPSLLGTFPNFGVGDKALYAKWFSQQLAKDMPERILPCHGGIISSVDLPKKLAALMKKQFGKVGAK